MTANTSFAAELDRRLNTPRGSPAADRPVTANDVLPAAMEDLTANVVVPQPAAKDEMPATEVLEPQTAEVAEEPAASEDETARNDLPAAIPDEPAEHELPAASEDLPAIDPVPELTPQPMAELEVPARASPADAAKVDQTASSDVPAPREHVRVAGLVSYATIPRVPTIYLARQPIELPRGGVVVLYGPGGFGKGTAMVDLAARVTRGELMLGGRPGSVLWCSYEDRQDETMSWRLDAAGADDRLVLDITDIPGHGTFGLDASGKTPGDVPLLATKIKAVAEAARNGEITGVPGEGAPMLVVVDPLLKSIRGGTIRMGDGPGRVLAMLDEVARMEGVTIVAVHHPVKGGKTMAGGAGIENGARLVYHVDREDAEAGVYSIRAVKSNNADKDTAPAARYQIVGAGKGAHVIWLPPETTQELPAWRVEAMATLPPAAFEGALPPVPLAIEAPEDEIHEAEVVHETEAVAPTELVKVRFRKGRPEYTYADPGFGLGVGDRVKVPVGDSITYTDVTSIGSSYTGTPKPVLKLIRRATGEPFTEAVPMPAEEVAR